MSVPEKMFSAIPVGNFFCAVDQVGTNDGSFGQKTKDRYDFPIQNALSITPSGAKEVMHSRGFLVFDLSSNPIEAARRAVELFHVKCREQPSTAGPQG